MKKIILKTSEYQSPELILLNVHTESILCLSAPGTETEPLIIDEGYNWV